MNLEEDLRTTLRDRAAEPAPRPDLWANVTAGVHRDRRRRRSLAAAAAVAVVVAGVTVPALLHDRGHDEPAVTATTNAPPVWETPVFPLRSLWLPDDIGGQVVTQMGPNTRLEYAEGSSVLAIEIGPLQAGWETEATDVHHADIHGTEAEVHVAGGLEDRAPGDLFVGVRWRWTGGRWVSVLSWGPRTEADVLKIARGLAGGGRVPVDNVPFSLPFAPPGLVLQQVGPAVMCLAPPQLAAGQRLPTGLCVSLTEGQPFDADDAEQTWTVDGRRVAYYPDAAHLAIEWGGDTQIDMTWDPELIRLSHDDVVRLANGVRKAAR